MTFDKATFDDFSNWIGEHLNKSLQKVIEAVQRIERQHAAAGRYQSGATIIEVFRESHAEFARGTATALGELKRAIRITDLDRNKLRQITESRLQEFEERVKSATKPDTLRRFAPSKLLDERLAEFDCMLKFALRQFDVGLLEPAEPEPPGSMTLSVGNMIGGAIQQGTVASTQSVSQTINFNLLREAVANFEGALPPEMPAKALAEIHADLATIKSQLSKAQPSTTILKEAGRSLRNVTEGIISSGLSGPLIAAAPALWTALGLG